MPSTTDIAVWGHAVPGWIARALSISGRHVSDIGGCGSAVPDALAGARRHADIRSFAAQTRGTPLLCTDLLTTADAVMLADGRPLLFSVEPVPAGACLGARPPRVCLLPGLPQGSMIMHAGEAGTEEGSCAHALVESSAPPEYGSALARIADGARAILTWMGMPDGVTCSLSGARPRKVRDDQPDAASRAIAVFEGTVSCLMRYADSRGAALVASASAPSWSRRVHLQRTDGTIVADDSMMVRLDRNANEVERMQADHVGPDAIAAVAAECLEQDGATERGQPESLTLRTAALVEAICLSGITGEWEEPARIEDILARSSRFADD